MRHVLCVSFLVLLAASPPLGAAPGTEFWAVLSDDESQFAEPLWVMVVNPDPVLSANVIVENRSGVVSSALVAPGAVQKFDLGITQQVSRTALVPYAYRVRSDVPVHAQQWVDYDTNLTFASASLLPDASTLGTRYVALTIAEPGGPSESRPSVVTIVARERTQVSVTPPVPTEAGGSVPALNPGETYTLGLEAFDVLQIGTLSLQGMTGAIVSASAPVAVFASCHNCHIGASAAENVQEAMLPVSQWAVTIPAVASSPLTWDVNLWQIVPAEDGTVVDSDPRMPGMPAVLDAGSYLEFQSTSDFLVTASKPVQVGRFNTWAWHNAGTSEDPASCLMLPPNLFSYGGSFALESNMPPGGFRWVDIVARPGTTVVVDGAVVAASEFHPIGSGEFLHAQVELSPSPEVHWIDADCPIGAYAGIVGTATTATFPVDITLASDRPPVELGKVAPLWLAKASGGQILFSWEDLGDPHMAYNVYEGTLRSIWSHRSLLCGQAGIAGPPGRRSQLIAPGSPGSHYYLMSASNCFGEGPSGGEPALSDCPP